MQIDLKSLLGKLNAYTKRSLETAAGLCVSRGNGEVTVDHLLLVFLDDQQRDIQSILRHYEIEPSAFKKTVQRAVEDLRAGHSGRPVFSANLVDWLTNAWLIGSVELGFAQIRSGTLFLALVADQQRLLASPYYDVLRQIGPSELRSRFFDVTGDSLEESDLLSAQKPAVASKSTTTAGQSFKPAPDGALARFTINFTEQARAGKIDPVFCRDREIQQMIDILGRRRKNNPICVGEPGVGKTSVVEGLALKIAEGDVPDFLRQVELVGLDLGMLQAGAGVKGEFEARLKGVIDEVRASPTPIVLFIDEAHTLVGAGGQAGGSDAANLLKPALARGELRTVAATTWSEYKKYFEKDPALARRFQLVKLDEPSPDEAVTIIRGLRGAYEKNHGVYVRDDAVVAAAKLSARYISGRQLPDKAVDVLDTACARVKLSLSAKPQVIDSRERKIAELKREHDALSRDLAADTGADATRIEEIDAATAKIEAELAELVRKWTAEKDLVADILALRQKLSIGPMADKPKGEAAAAGTAEASAVAITDEAGVRAALAAKVGELDVVQARNPIVHYEVTPEAIGQVISDWTGIPLGSMVRDEASAVLTLAANLGRRIKGQNEAIEAIDAGIRAAKASLNSPSQPQGTFLFVGPSGVGKTEMATAIADLLFGGERFMVSINMSEFQEKHTVSKLVGSPPGYVGYGEGGVLTEAVRQRPYSVVLLDEVEKADLEVMNLFYQVFDKGVLSDGEGRQIDFRNTIIFLTSNLATDAITELGQMTPRPTADQITEAIRPILSKHFKPALLARMQIVPFFPLFGDVLNSIVRLKLEKVVQRLWTVHRIGLDYTDAVVEQIAARCTEVETGARAIDHIVNRRLLPDIATEVLARLADETLPERLTIDVNDGGGFDYVFGEEETAVDEAAA
ncbi:MAG: type VI secretion system ATPase TssH [Ancalomicrobiaceae bacterium]|nr:type VI secretion system ATPase TssH [Ancalomicrobiaceae bacterium]